MKTIAKSAELKDYLDMLRKDNKTVGFVPTMGALHDGHLSLVGRSAKENNCTVVSIFVNPLQFDNSDDLKSYPRNVAHDLDLLKPWLGNSDIVFVPDVEEVYKEPTHEIFEFGYLNKIMEGKYRNDHFNGVASVLKRLFELVGQANAYFGEKDYQQLVIVKNLVNMLNIPINIVPCPIIREKDGLAMSSRNLLLSESQRKSAALISQILHQAKKFVYRKSIPELQNWVIEKINVDNSMQTEYFQIVEKESLMPAMDWEGKNDKIGCVAVRIGKIRLIDNIQF